jgi:hypothetical protein
MAFQKNVNTNYHNDRIVLKTVMVQGDSSSGVENIKAICYGAARRWLFGDGASSREEGFFQLYRRLGTHGYY